MDPSSRVMILGAGAAGLAAARRLEAERIPYVLIEARDRSGGRVLTLGGDPPVELGAEFVHGRPEGLWQLIKDTGAHTHPLGETHLLWHDGVLTRVEGFWE